MELDPDALDRHITGNYGEGNPWDDEELDDYDPPIDDEDEDDRDFDSMPGGADYEDFEPYFEDDYPDSAFDFYD